MGRPRQHKKILQAWETRHLTIFIFLYIISRKSATFSWNVEQKMFGDSRWNAAGRDKPQSKECHTKRRSWEAEPTLMISAAQTLPLPATPGERMKSTPPCTPHPFILTSPSPSAPASLALTKSVCKKADVMMACYRFQRFDLRLDWHLKL